MGNFFLDNKDLQFHLNHPLMKKIVDSQNAYIKKVAAYKDSLRMAYPAWAYK